MGPRGQHLSVVARQSRKSNGMTSIVSFPASIFEKSRMSLMTVSSDSPDALTMSRYSRCSESSSVSSASSVMPMTPFMGVRISWLMLARNSLLARLAARPRPRRVFSRRFGLERQVGAKISSALDRSACSAFLLPVMS